MYGEFKSRRIEKVEKRIERSEKREIKNLKDELAISIKKRSTENKLIEGRITLDQYNSIARREGFKERSEPIKSEISRKQIFDLNDVSEHNKKSAEEVEIIKKKLSESKRKVANFMEKAKGMNLAKASYDIEQSAIKSEQTGDESMRIAKELEAINKSETECLTDLSKELKKIQPVLGRIFRTYQATETILINSYKVHQNKDKNIRSYEKATTFFQELTTELGKGGKTEEELDLITKVFIVEIQNLEKSIKHHLKNKFVDHSIKDAIKANIKTIKGLEDWVHTYKETYYDNFITKNRKLFEKYIRVLNDEKLRERFYQKKNYDELRANKNMIHYLSDLFKAESKFFKSFEKAVNLSINARKLVERDNRVFNDLIVGLDRIRSEIRTAA